MTWQKTPLDIFIPEDRRQALFKGERLPARTRGAVLFADISGFTNLTGVLSRELGPKRGAEELIRQLDPIYTNLIQAVHSYRGSVIVISGDGITCWFDQDDGRHATGCAFAMQAAMADYETISLPTGEQMQLGIKITAAVGPAQRFLVGDPDIQRIETLAGRQLDEAVAAQQLLASGEVAVSEDLLRALDGDVPVRAYRQISEGSRFAVLGRPKILLPADPWPELPLLDAEIAQQWVAAPVHKRIRDEEIEFLTELRLGVPMFVKFTGLDYDNDESAEAKLDTFIRRVQGVLARYEGSLCQLTIGDKGSNLYIAFGAPVAHEDDIHRALSAALLLQEQASGLGFIQPLQISLTYGQLWAGAHGGSRARTYSVIGAEVNLAARLMDHAKPGQVLVSPHIVDATQHYSFAPLSPMNFKGISKPLTPFLLLGRARQPRVPVQRRMIGREGEQAILQEKLEGLLYNEKKGMGGVVLVEGEAGIGKSLLLADLAEKAAQAGVRSLSGFGDPVELSTPYFGIRPVFEALFGTSEEEDLSANQQRVLAAIQGNAFLTERLPLLSEVIPLRLPDNELTEQIRGEARASSIREFLLEVLRHLLFPASGPTPTLIVLDDAQWMDSATWNSMGYIVRELPGILLLVGMRPFEGDQLAAQNMEEYQRLRAGPNTTHIHLQAMPEDDVLALLARKLGVRSLPTPITAFIQARAQGNPFFSEEIAYALRDAGVIQFENSHAIMRLEAEELERLDFPRTIQGVITSRIDRLPPAHQLTLKVASVIGRAFLLNMLANVHPSRVETSTLAAYLKLLTQLGITEVEALTPEETYLFKHVITQEVVYNLLTFSQRKQLHCAIAAWYEIHYAENPSPYYPRLAHHYVRGEVQEKAIHYLDKAAEQALELYANQDVIRFLSLALELTRPGHMGAGSTHLELHKKLQLGRWQRMLGIAHLQLGHLTESLEHYQEALRILGRPMPQTRLRILVNLFKELLTQAWHRLRPPGLRYTGAGREKQQLEQEMAKMAIDEVLYFSQDAPLLAWTLLRRLNVAERVGMWVGMAESYCNLAMFAAFAQNKRLLTLYRDLTWKAVAESNRSSTRLYALVRDGVSYFVGCHWDEAEQRFQEGKVLAEQLGDTRNLALLTASDATSRLMQGKYQESLEIWKENYQRALKQDNPQELAWSLYGQGHSLLRLGEIDEAVRLLEASIATPMKNADDKRLNTSRFGALSLAFYRKGQWEKTLEAILQHQRVAPNSPSFASTMQEYETVFDAMIGLWQKCQTGEAALAPRDRDCLEQAFRRIPRMAKALRPNRVNQAKTYLYEGLYTKWTGDPARARHHWLKCIELAEQHRQPYELGRAHYELALQAEGQDRSVHLDRAQEIFRRLRTPYELDLVQHAPR